MGVESFELGLPRPKTVEDASTVHYGVCAVDFKRRAWPDAGRALPEGGLGERLACWSASVGASGAANEQWEENEQNEDSDF